MLFSCCFPCLWEDENITRGYQNSSRGTEAAMKSQAIFSRFNPQVRSTGGSQQASLSASHSLRRLEVRLSPRDLNSAITKLIVCTRMVVEVGCHLTKMVPFQSIQNFFLTKGFDKSSCDFTRTIFVQCENPVFIHTVFPSAQNKEQKLS